MSEQKAKLLKRTGFHYFQNRNKFSLKDRYGVKIDIIQTNPLSKTERKFAKFLDLKEDIIKCVRNIERYTGSGLKLTSKLIS